MIAKKKEALSSKKQHTLLVIIVMAFNEEASWFTRKYKIFARMILDETSCVSNSDIYILALLHHELYTVQTDSGTRTYIQAILSQDF